MKFTLGGLRLTGAAGVELYVPAYEADLRIESQRWQKLLVQ